MYIRTSTKPNKFTFKILGFMGPPPWEDITVPVAPDGGHYVNACSTCPYIYIYTHTSNKTQETHFENPRVYGAPSLGGHYCAFSP